MSEDFELPSEDDWQVLHGVLGEGGEFASGTEAKVVVRRLDGKGTVTRVHQLPRNVPYRLGLDYACCLARCSMQLLDQAERAEVIGPESDSGFARYRTLLIVRRVGGVLHESGVLAGLGPLPLEYHALESVTGTGIRGPG